MEIKNDLLRRMLAKPFGLNICSQNLLETSSSQEDDSSDSELIKVDESLRARAGQRLYAEVINHQLNTEDVVQRADDILQADPDIDDSQEEPDQGWVEDCLDGAGRTYNDNLKDYWAKLLAGEIKKPGTYSKRAVNFMKTLSQKDAERIRNMCQYVMYDTNKEDAFLLRYDKKPYTYKDVIYLGELGLLDSSSTVVKKYEFIDDNGGAALFVHNDIGVFINIRMKEYHMPIYTFTELGKEILSIIDDQDANMDYIKDYSKSICEKNKKLEIRGGHIYEKDDSYYIVDDDIHFYFGFEDKK